MSTTTTLRRLAVPAALALALVAVPACSSDSKSETSTGGATTAAPSQAEVKITDVWSRTSPMDTKVGAVYANLTANKDDKLVKASVDSSIAGEVQIHETVMSSTDGTAMKSDSMGATETTAMKSDSMGTTDGTAMGDSSMNGMTMKEVAAIDLPAGKTVELKPGGYHIMLLDLTKPLTAGETFKVTFTFEKAEPITVDATVREG